MPQSHSTFQQTVWTLDDSPGVPLQGPHEPDHWAYIRSDIANSLSALRDPSLCEDYFFGLSAEACAPSEFHVSRTYNHFPPFFTETERYLPLSTTFPDLSLTS